MTIRGNWIRNAIKAIRWSRVLAYLAVAVSGVASVLHPPASVQGAAAHGYVVLAWAALLALSSLVCAWGAITDRWVGEYVGLLPLGMSALVFAVSALSRGTTGIAGGAFLAGFFWLLASRWQEVALLRIESDRHARRVQDKEGT